MMLYLFLNHHRFPFYPEHPNPKPENTGTPNTENKPGDAANGSTTPNPDNTTIDQPAKTPLKKGYSYSDGKLKYKVVNNATDGTGTVSVVGYKAKKAKLTKVVIPASVTIQGTKYLVTDIAKNAFKGIHSKAVIKVPAAKLKAYQKLMKKKGQGSKVKIKK